jgi:hypothetical protein
MVSDYGRKFSRTATVPPFCTPNRALIDLLEAILAGLDVQQTVGEQFTQERLAELGAQFNLADSDWGQLFCMIHRLKA